MTKRRPLLVAVDSLVITFAAAILTAVVIAWYHGARSYPAILAYWEHYKLFGEVMAVIAPIIRAIREVVAPGAVTSFVARAVKSTNHADPAAPVDAKPVWETTVAQRVAAKLATTAQASALKDAQSLAEMTPAERQAARLKADAERAPVTNPAAAHAAIASVPTWSSVAVRTPTVTVFDRESHPYLGAAIEAAPPIPAPPPAPAEPAPVDPPAHEDLGAPPAPEVQLIQPAAPSGKEYHPLSFNLATDLRLLQQIEVPVAAVVDLVKAEGGALIAGETLKTPPFPFGSSKAYAEIRVSSTQDAPAFSLAALISAISAIGNGELVFPTVCQRLGILYFDITLHVVPAALALPAPAAPEVPAA